MNDMKYAAVIRDSRNVIVRVEERPTEARAIMAGQFFERRNRGWWWSIAHGDDVIDMFKRLINA